VPLFRRAEREWEERTRGRPRGGGLPPSTSALAAAELRSSLSAGAESRLASVSITAERPASSASEVLPSDEARETRARPAATAAVSASFARVPGKMCDTGIESSFFLTSDERRSARGVPARAGQAERSSRSSAGLVETAAI